MSVKFINLENLTHFWDNAKEYIDNERQEVEDQFYNGGIPAKLSETDPSVNPARLLEAIEEAHEKGTYVSLPAGTFVFHNPVMLPQGTMGNWGYGYTVCLVGATDQFPLAINRKYQGNDTTFHVEHYGTVLVYDGTDAMFYEKKNFVSLKNISFRNEDISNDSQHIYLQQALFMKRYDNEDLTERSRILVQNCSFFGWARCFGDVNIGERISIYAEWCRFTANTYALCNIHDSRVVECSFNGGTNAFIFEADRACGGSTIANNRIEWTSEDGILIDTNQAHMISILGNEFDRCGGCAIKATNGRDISVKDNFMSRSGALVTDEHETESYHLFFENVKGLSLTGNETRYAHIQDFTPSNGIIIKRPYLSYHIEQCNYVKMQANDWSGCKNGAQLGTKMSRWMSLESNQVKTFVPYGSYGVLTFISMSGAGRTGIAYYALGHEEEEEEIDGETTVTVQSQSAVGSKLAGGDSFIVLTNVDLPLAEHSYTGELVVSVTNSGIQVWNTKNDPEASAVVCSIFQIS